jgi:hypothetical protein
VDRAAFLRQLNIADPAKFGQASHCEGDWGDLCKQDQAMAGFAGRGVQAVIFWKRRETCQQSSDASWIGAGGFFSKLAGAQRTGFTRPACLQGTARARQPQQRYLF